MGLEVIRDPREMRRRTEALRLAGKTIALVPTMGYLHGGHLSLLREGRRRGDVLVLSIFVNPTQFGPNEDLQRYPRDEEGDLEKARGAGVDLVFAPEPGAMYPEGYQTYVTVEKVSQGLCGERRPGHFRGVASVVTKLFNIVRPHVALFGEKDYQQLQVLRRMVLDLNMDIEIVGLPIVREPDGLAQSSRNKYLSPDQREQALCLYRALEAAEAIARAGERDARAILKAARRIIEKAPLARIDYVELRDAHTLEPLTWLDRPAVLLLAVHLGQTRLIDNRLLPG